MIGRLASIVLVALGLAPGAAAAQEMTCRSRNYEYQFCSAPGEVIRATLVQQQSSAACIEGRTWGSSANGIWVSNGCAGRFRVETFSPVPPPSPGGERMSCDSRNFQYEFCRVPARVYSAELLRQKSQSSCIVGRTWGWREDGVWVSNGCQGEFRVQTAYRPTPPYGPGITTCESHGFRYNFCRAGPLVGAQLVEQRSKAPCVRDRTWGWTPDGVWVDQGCSATFRLRQRW